MKKQLLFALSTIFLLNGQISAQPATIDKHAQATNEDKNVAQIKSLSNEFINHFHGPYTVSEENAETFGEKRVPQLNAAGGEVLNNNPKVGPFAARNHVYATIFAKSGDEFIVISTPLKREKGPGARGTALDHDHPAYKNLSKGLGFTGKITLFGKDFIAKYDVIKDRKDNVVGAVMVAKPLFNKTDQ
jgi:methyl-accepting chemotaxis protein-2 (aspartate sensor receptor)